jgi:tetratricopeptide (TPR) repeat protein
MARGLAWICVLAIVCLAGSAASAGNIQTAQAACLKGEVSKAEKDIKPMEAKTGDSNYPLAMLSLGSIDLCLGDYRHAAACMQSAIASFQGEITGLGVAAQVLKSESGRLYRGFSHERVLAHTYIGLAYMQQGKTDDARIEFAKASEEDKGKSAAQVDDFGPPYFLDGIRALRDRDYHYSRVSFRKVVELQPGFALGWYSLARASLLDGDEGEADQAWAKYESLVTPGARLAKDGSTPCAIFLVDVGWGPKRTPDPLIGEFATWEKTKSAESRVVLAGAGGQGVDAGPVGDMYFQASTAGGFSEDLKKKVVSVAAKQAVAYALPLAGLFLKSEADVRCWMVAPGAMYFVAVPVSAEPSTVEMTAYDAKGNLLPIDNQVIYYIVGRPYEEAQIVYARVMPNADYRESD